MANDLISRMRLLEQDHEPNGWPAVQMRDISALLAEVEALRKKAARYDWLRDNWGYVTETYTGSGPQVESVYLVSKDDGWDTDPDSLDAAIDAALRAKEAEHG